MQKAREGVLTLEERRRVLRYSGWGGLSIDRVRGKLPAEWLPDEAGLIHEYYTPSLLCAELARVLKPLLGDLAGEDGLVQALEPSAGATTQGW